MLSKLIARNAVQRAAGAAVAFGARRVGLAALSRGAAAAATQRPAAVVAAAAAAARVPVRAFATAQKSGKPAAAAAPAPAKPSPAAQLQAVKTELSALLSKEVQEIGQMGMEPDHPYNAYVKDNGLEIEHNAETGAVTISKSLHGYDIDVLFRAQPDPDNDDDMPSEGAENEGKGEAETEGKEKNEKESENEENEPTHNYSFIVNVTPTGATGGDAFSVFAVSPKEDKLWFEGLRVSEKPATLDDYPEMDYNDLPTALQDKIADFMDLLKIDEEFAQFVPAVAVEISRLDSLKQLERLHKFVSK